MAKVLFKVFFTIITTIVNIILLPLDSMMSGLFPDLTATINNFNVLVSQYIGGSFGWFAHFLPPTVKQLVLIYLTFLIAFYSFYWGYLALTKVWKLIKKIKFW